jgi:hypothetical protein
VRKLTPFHGLTNFGFHVGGTCSIHNQSRKRETANIFGKPKVSFLKPNVVQFRVDKESFGTGSNARVYKVGSSGRPSQIFVLTYKAFDLEKLGNVSAGIKAKNWNVCIVCDGTDLGLDR